MPAQCVSHLDAAGGSLAQVVSATFVLGEESDFAGMNEEWLRWFPVDPPHARAQSCRSARRE